MGRGNLRDVWDGSEDHCIGPARFGKPSGRSGTGWGTFGNVVMGQGTLKEVRDESGDTRGGPGRVGEPQGDPGRVGGLPRRSGTGLWTLG